VPISAGTVTVTPRVGTRILDRIYVGTDLIWQQTVPIVAPNSPIAVVAEEGGDYIPIFWIPDSLGSAATGYRIRARTYRSSSDPWKTVTVTETTQGRITELPTGRRYETQVQAFNTVGSSAWVDAKTFAPNAITGNKPAGWATLTAVPGAGNTALVSWTLPDPAPGTLVGFSVHHFRYSTGARIAAYRSRKAGTSRTVRNVIAGDPFWVRSRPEWRINGTKTWGLWTAMLTLLPAAGGGSGAPRFLPLTVDTGPLALAGKDLGTFEENSDD